MNQNKFLIQVTLQDTFLHRLNGETKVRLFVVALVAVIMSFDLRILVPILLASSLGVLFSKPNWKSIRIVFLIVVGVNLLNLILFYLANPSLGEYWCGENTIIHQFSTRYYVSVETLWYLLVRFIKMVTSFMVSLWFILTITPSQFAAGLAAHRVPYKVATIVSLGFRYIPDIARDYENIKLSMQMRGVELDPKKASISKRLKQSLLILIPLIITSFDRVSTIANGMDLRGFGRGKRRSYYVEQDPTVWDKRVRFITNLVFILSIVYIVGSMIWPAPTNMWCPL